MYEPVLIQGGMGVGVSNWCLAKAVSSQGHLGVVSGTLLENVFARRLQEGDPDGHLKRACLQFPDQKLSERVWQTYFIEGGKKTCAPYKSVPMFSLIPPKELVELTILANFVEVWLAKEGHQGLIGINYLEKIQLPTLPSLYGSMLAGVDYVLMGAGIPKAIPGILDRLSKNLDVSLKIDVAGDSEKLTQEPITHFSPSEFLAETYDLKRPKFIAVVSSHTLAANLAKKSSGKVDGFVVENHTAGGHNAPPRGTLKLDENNEPIYGPRDSADLEEMKKLNLPFWLAGKYGTNEALKQAKLAGANGVQVGTPFAFCKESGIDNKYKEEVLKKILHGEVKILTDYRASTSGYPFKVVEIEGTISEKDVFENRKRVCDLGGLRQAYTKDDGTIGFRCPGEPEDIYLKKGGNKEDIEGRKCLCNALLATISLGQQRNCGSLPEPAIVTAGDHLVELSQFISPTKLSYSAKEVIQSITGNSR
ncbi:MAG: nitronate monooxygenase [Candidatus Melainabacteria bacterium]|nr:MAG: nitronate monooxygenase [Candidatus Melainabacteria bacterium]